MWLFVCRSAPTQPLAVRELVDMVMMAAVFGHDVRLLLLGDGALNLAPDCVSPINDLEGLLASPCLVEACALSAGATPTAEPVSDRAIQSLFRDSSRVVMF